MKIWDFKGIVFFYLKRIVRIYPSLILALIFAVAVRFCTIETALKVLIMKASYSHFWVLPLELLFYIIFPFLCMIMNKLGIKKNFAGLTCCIAFIWIYYYLIIGENTYSFLYCLPMFLGGIVVSLAKHMDIPEWLNIQHFDIAMCFVVIAFLGIGNVYYNFSEDILIKANAIVDIEFLRFAFGPLLIWITFWAFGHHETIREKLEKCSALIYLGDISYPFYLFHYIILSVVQSLCNVADVNRWNIILICFAGSMAVSIVIHEVVEKRVVGYVKAIYKLRRHF